MQLPIRLFAPLLLATGPLISLAAAQGFGPDFANDYSFVDLGLPPGVPGPLGGLTFAAGDPDTLLIGGSANQAGGAIYEVPVMRDAQGHVTAFGAASTLFATAPQIDGGLVYGPGGVLFFTTFSNNMLGQILPGSGSPDKMIDLSALGVCSSTGSLNIVPVGFAGAGTIKLASFSCSTWYSASAAPDVAGTYDLINLTQTATVQGGPEGLVYIDSANPGFTVDSVLISEYAASQVGAYEIDAAGDPIPSTRREFMIGLSGAEGAVIDPLTGDFLFSTFGSGNRVIVVSGFTAPTIYCAGKTNSLGCVPTILFAGTPTLTGVDDFVVASTNATNHCIGTLAWSQSPDTLPFSGGTLCLGTPLLFSFPRADSGGNPGVATDCSGQFSVALTQSWMNSAGLTAGMSVYTQFISRDLGFPAATATGLSDALSFKVLP